MVLQWCSGANASQAFDFRFEARNLDVSWHEGKFAQATPWCRSGVCAGVQAVTLLTLVYHAPAQAAAQAAAHAAVVCVRARRQSRY